ncbi:MAG TPA: anhydro-N-acetylmuramic acid kinase [Usitatibacter sp.]|nr:anhydro-N-acetylmuramic acid kinase [Usitatibacter sp.]
MDGLFVGLMSGTSLDGADAALVDFSAGSPRTLGFASVAFPDELREDILALSAPGRDSIELEGRVATQLGNLYAQAVRDVLASTRVQASRVSAIGCHGQTIRHRPDLGFTIQVNDPARLAELTGIDVVADFRRRDMAAGGQGAPLVPAFHEAVFRTPDASRAVVNIGGISNITWLPVGGRTIGFDCGPGNVLLDGWARRHLGARYDEDGRWAGAGRTDAALLARLLDEPYFSLPPPKSTGRELFRLEWLEERLPADYRTADVQSTLTDFTAHSIVRALRDYCPGTREVFLAGGGARNHALVERIRALCEGCRVDLTDAIGVPTAHVESMAFAWLAMKCSRREPIDLSAVTGARAPRILGAIYPA